jgi:signal transduction histidine kinase/ActR/RegA family two-component response regulator
VRKGFAGLPIRLKLIGMIMTVTVTVSVLASLGYLVGDYYQTRREVQRDLLAQADLILKNTDAAVKFTDDETAGQILATLGALPNMRIACLYNEKEELFASFRAVADAVDCPSTAPADGILIEPNRIEVSRPGFLDGTKFGSVTLRADLEAVRQRIEIQVTTVALLLLVAMAVAIIMSARLQRIVSNPITDLAQTVRDVSARGDYSLRAKKTTDDELGVLVDAFNRMLDRVDERDAALSKANDELSREVLERRRMEKERAELLVREREANRLKDEFLATLSHELRTPLNAILGWTKLLRSNAVAPNAVDRALEKVERNAQVQARLIEDLLEVSRIVSGKLRLDYRPFDLVALGLTAFESIRPTAEARGINLRRDFGPTPLMTAGDPDRLQQVIWNLLSNAVKFTPSGGTVTMTIRRREGIDEITVSDTGIGIEPEFLPSVFETFRQADASSTRTHGGLGLGLAIVRQLVELHGGDVSAASEGKDRGATVTVTLPVRTAERRRAREGDLQPPAPIEGRLAGRRILVVDDDADTRELLVSILERAGADVRAAASAQEGLALSLDEVPEAFVSDIAMPGMDGYDLMRHLTETLGSNAPRVRLALSAFAAPVDRERSLQAGFHRHLAKPIDPAVLVRMLDEMLADTGALP